jgi:hypothetical protein
MSDHRLPQAFADLECHVAEWSLDGEKARAEKRVSTAIVKLRAFHAAVAPRMESIIQYLNTFPNTPHDLPADVTNLFRMAQMAMEASAPIDLGWDCSDIDDVFPMDRMKFHRPSGR